MATVKLIAKKKSTRKDGTTPIYLQYSFNSEKRTLINTGFKIEPKYWNSDDELVRKSHSDYKRINREITKKKNKISELIFAADENDLVPTIKYILDNYKKPKSIENNIDMSFFEHFDSFIESSKGRVVDSVIYDYKSLKKHLLEFEKFHKEEISFKTIDYSFYERFVSFLKYEVKNKNNEKGLATNTVGKQIKNLKVFLNNMVRKKTIQNIDLTGFIKLEEEVINIYLNEDEIKRIYKLGLSEKPELTKYRDLLVFGCLNRHYINLFH
jgi:hypothetical protein